MNQEEKKNFAAGVIRITCIELFIAASAVIADSSPDKDIGRAAIHLIPIFLGLVVLWNIGLVWVEGHYSNEKRKNRE